ncbi:hypothetical protein [Streptomyces fagopyri]|uniref:hypothetical protein n=1 Tax=Streptomyces fagopyri TaxID=2662397 RepID=UPI00371D3545
MTIKAPKGLALRATRGRRKAGLALGTALLAFIGTCAATGTAQADSYLRVATTTLSGRTITLWYNQTARQWHAEISGASAGDRIHLDYANNPLSWYYVSTTVASGTTYANTSDETLPVNRACGFVGSSSKCTGWWTA